MGGKAFGVRTSQRLSIEEYNIVRSAALLALTPLYACVRTPPLEPEKATHGDVDFLVHTPLAETNHSGVCDALRAVDSIKASPTSNFLVLLDEESTNAAKERYAQVDVHICDADEIDMLVFTHSYGRLGHIICHLLHCAGLHLTEKGLYTNTPKTNEPGFLTTRQVSHLLTLLNLSVGEYEAGFATIEAVFTWIENGRLAGRPLWRFYRSDKQASRGESRMIQEWDERRLLVTSDFGYNLPSIAEVRLAILKRAGRVEEYREWQLKQDQLLQKRQEQDYHQRQIADEVKRRMQGCSESGAARGVIAKEIRTQVEAEYANL